MPDPSAQQDDAYLRIWQNLRTMTHVRDGRHDTETWRAAAGPFVMACVKVPQAALDPEISDLRAALQAFPFVRLHPGEFLHIPVQELGFLLDESDAPFALSQSRLKEFIAMAERPLLDFPSFPVVVGPVNSFSDAAFLDVHDGGWISRIRSRMLDFVPFQPPPKYPYVPHVTIAHYTGDAPISNLPAVLAEWRDVEIGAFVVQSVDVVSLSTKEPFPPFEVLHRFHLGSTRATGSIPLFPRLNQD